MIGVLAPGSRWARYATEMLAHAGFSYQESTLPPAGRLLLVPAAQSAPESLRAWVTAGGGLVVLGDPGPLAELAGVEVVEPVAEGHVRFDAGWPPDVDLHAFGGVKLAAQGASVVAEWVDQGGAVTVHGVGAGVVVVIGADVCQSVVRIRQGFPVTGDGVPPADGTAPVDEGILKCEDGLALSYTDDRAMPPGALFTEPFTHDYPPTAPAPMFHRPHADLWAEVLVAAIYLAAARLNEPLARIDYWPHGVPAVAHMSHDSDSNTDESARAALRTFQQADVRVTWCVLHPGGYSPALYPEILAAGHEIGLHYDAMADHWDEDHFVAQHAWLRREAGVETLVTNKNHYTRWEGWAEFYAWCERAGIQVDQSRGPSKQGVVGFPFGTCHPSFPLGDDGNIVDVLTLPLHTQDLWWTAVEEVREVILDQALARRGVAHFLFHGRNLLRDPRIGEAVLATAAAARTRGMPWWTSEQINEWERRRREVLVEITPAGMEVCLVNVYSPEPIANVALTVQWGRHIELAVDLAAGHNQFTVRREP